MHKLLFTTLLAVAPLAGQAQTNEVWFDQPTTLNGQQCWWKGQKDHSSKPVRAGDSAVNSDHEIGRAHV